MQINRLAALTVAAFAAGACAGAGAGDGLEATGPRSVAAADPAAQSGASATLSDDELCAAESSVAPRVSLGRAPTAEELASIRDVVVEGAVTDEAAIREALGIVDGRLVDPSKLPLGVERIWALGSYEDVRLTLSTGTENHGKLLVDLQARAPVGRLVLRGASAMSQEQALEALSLRAGAPFDAQGLWQGRALLREQYEQMGYRAARVEPHLSKGSAVDVCIVIEEGVRSIVRTWNLTGADAIDAETLTTLVDRAGGINAPGGVFRPDVWARDALRLQAWYYDRGYLEARVHDPAVETTADGRSLDVVVRVEQGPVYRIRAITVTGAAKLAGHDYTRGIESRVGEVFSRSKVAADIERLRAKQRELAPLAGGVDVTPLTELDPSRGLVSIELRIE